MSMPVLSLEFAPGDNWDAASPTWVDITAYMRPPFNITRGRDEPFTRMRPGRMTVTLDNRDGRFDPENDSGPYAGDLVPIVPIRLRATHNSVTYPLYRGFVSAWPIAQTDFKDATVTVTARDGLSQLNLFNIAVASYTQNVAALSPVGYWKMDETAGSTATDSGSAGVDGTYDDSPTLNQTGPYTGVPAVVFDQSDPDGLTIGAVTGVDTEADWTWMGWMKPDSTAADDDMVIATFADNTKATDDPTLRWFTGGSGADKLTFRYSTGAGAFDFATTLSTLSYAADTWTHVALVFDFSEMTLALYGNGLLDSTWDVSDWDTTDPGGDMNLVIGNFRVGGSETGFSAFGGSLTQNSVWASALSAGDIANIYAGQGDGLPSPLTLE